MCAYLPIYRTSSENRILVRGFYSLYELPIDYSMSDYISYSTQSEDLRTTTTPAVTKSTPPSTGSPSGVSVGKLLAFLFTTQRHLPTDNKTTILTQEIPWWLLSVFFHEIASGHDSTHTRFVVFSSSGFHF